MRGISIAGHFWSWFQKTHAEYLALFSAKRSRAEQYYLMNELRVHLRAYCRLLSPDLTISEDFSKGEMVITAGGNWRAFKKAERFVAKAPVIPGWTFIALAPPHHHDDSPELEKARIAADVTGAWFQIDECEKETLYIIVFVKYILPKKEDDVWHYLQLTVLNLVGEKADALDVFISQVLTLDEADETKPLYELEELPVIMGSAASGVTIEADGSIKGI